MNGKKAKKIRKLVYGTEYSPSFRKYRKNTKTGQIISDEKRMTYQLIKRNCTRIKGHTNVLENLSKVKNAV